MTGLTEIELEIAHRHLHFQKPFYAETSVLSKCVYLAYHHDLDVGSGVVDWVFWTRYRPCVVDGVL